MMPESAGELLYKEGLFREAIALNEGLLSDKRLPPLSNITESEILHHIGFNIHSLDQENPQAAAFYRRALDSDPLNTRAMHSLANVYRDSHQYSRTIDLYRTILSIDPADILTHKAMLELYMRRQASWNDVESSFTKLEEVWKLGKDTSTIGSIGVVLARVNTMRIVEATAQVTSEQYAASLKSVQKNFKEAIRRSTVQRAAPSHFFYGVFLYDTLGEADKGIKEMEAAVKLLQKSYIRHGSSGRSFAFVVLRKLIHCYESQAGIRPAEAGSLRSRLELLTADRGLLAKVLATLDPDEAAAELKAQLAEKPSHWLDWWFLGHTYETMYRPQEAFDAFWKAAESRNLPTSFSQLRSIVDGWRDPATPATPLKLDSGLRGLIPSWRSDEYHFKILDGDLPEANEIARFFDHCRRLKTGLQAANWDTKKVNECMLACAERAYQLDREGKASVKNITDYACDLLDARRAPEARPLFEQVQKLEERCGHKPCFALWQIGECCMEMSGGVTLECARYFIRSAALENTRNVNTQLFYKLRDSPASGEDLAALVVGVYCEDKRYESAFLIENLVPTCLARIWKSREGRVSQDTLDRLIGFERDHPIREASEMVAVALQRNRNPQGALPYFEKLDRYQDLPEYVLISYKLYLRAIPRQRERFMLVSRILEEKQRRQTVV